MVHRGRRSLRAAVVLVGVSLVAASASAQITNNAQYKVVNKNSAKCVDAAAAVRLQQRACNGSAAQSFQIGTGSATPTPTAVGPTPTSTPSGTGLSMLRASGRNIVNAQNQVVHLRGVNLGAWLMFEDWMS